MSTQGSDFFEALRSLKEKGTRQMVFEETALQSLRRITESFSLVDATPELEQRDKTYFVVPENKLANPSFETDLSSWTTK